MKKISILLFASIMMLQGCKKQEVVSTDPAATAKTAIEAKFKAIGWDKDGHAPFNGGGAAKTAGGKGYVQYYAFGSRKTAIYYFEGKGAFAMDTEEMTAYDKAGQDNFSLVVSDPKATLTGGCGYNDILLTGDGSEGIITCQFFVYGEIYKKYKALNRWNGPLGLPTNSESDLSSKRGRFNTFSKGQIYYGSVTGAQAFWGKIDLLYKAAGYDGGWLGLPTSSCDMGVTEGKQLVRFEKGVINGLSTCGSYQNPQGETLYQNGTKASNPANVPCYNPQ